jgi:small-conductance mechanosensitive channel
MPGVVDQPWFWPVLAVVVGLPVLTVVANVVGADLRRRGSGAWRIVRLVRNYLLPTGAVSILLWQVTEALDSTDFTWSRLVTTLFGFVLILAVLNTVNFALFQNARSGSWRERLPSIFLDIGRIILIAIGLAVLFRTVWGTDVAGLFTALGVTSIMLGLALQGAIGSVVSGLLLLFEQPFRLGDWLDAGGVRGRVVQVNWRAVHIDTGNGVQIMPNAALAGAAFTNLSRGDGSFTVTTPVTFTTDDPPAEVVALLQRVASGLPDLTPGTAPTAVPLGGAAYEVSFDVRGPSLEGAALATFRGWLWYAARRAGLGLDGDATDASVTPEALEAAVASVAPTLQLTADDVPALVPLVRLERWAAGEVLLRPGTVPEAVRFVLRGVVALSVPTGDGGALPVSRVEAGDYVAQTALTREVQATQGTAVTEVTVLVVPATTLDDLVRARPRVARDLGEVIDRRRDEVRDVLAAARGDDGPGAAAEQTGRVVLGKR